MSLHSKIEPAGINIERDIKNVLLATGSLIFSSELVFLLFTKWFCKEKKLALKCRKS